MKQSEVKVGAIVAIREREYYSEPAALTIASDKPQAHQRWTGKRIDCNSWRDGGVLLSGGAYEMIRKLSQVIPHAEAMAEYRRQKESREAGERARRERNNNASAIRSELQAMAPDGLLVDVSERTMTVTITGKADDARRMFAQVAEVGK